MNINPSGIGRRDGRHSSVVRPNERTAKNENNSRLWATYCCFIVLIVLRMCIPDNVLNLFMGYSGGVSGAGSVFSKLHPTTWGLFILLGMNISHVIEKLKTDRPVITALAVFSGMVLCIGTWAVLSGRTSSMGFLVDSFLVACCGGFIMSTMPQNRQYEIGHVLLITIGINSFIALIEYFLQARLYPYPYSNQWATFRATALFGHPLTTGGINTTAVVFIYLTRWRWSGRLIMIIIVCAGSFAAGARSSSILCIGLAIISFLTLSGSRDQFGHRVLVKMTVVFAACALLPIVLWAFYNVGLFERFERSGLFDGSAMTRINSFKAFDYITADELLWGVDIHLLNKIALLGDLIEKNMKIESGLVIWIFQFGLIWTIGLIFGLLRISYALSRQLAWPGRFANGLFFVGLIQSNGMASKGFAVLLIILLSMSFRWAGNNAKL